MKKTGKTFSIPPWALLGDLINPMSNGLKGWWRVFDRDRFACVYCGRDLFAGPDRLVGTTTDHIIPQSKFPERGEPRPNREGNLAAACAVCNNLKGNFVLPASDAAWQTRESYVEALSAFVRNRLHEKLAEYRQLLVSLRKQRLVKSPTSRSTVRHIDALVGTVKRKGDRREPRNLRISANGIALSRYSKTSTEFMAGHFGNEAQHFRLAADFDAGIAIGITEMEGRNKLETLAEYAVVLTIKQAEDLVARLSHEIDVTRHVAKRRRKSI